MRPQVIGYALLVAVGALLFAWGLGLVLTAGQDEEGARGFFGWIFLVFGLVVAGGGMVGLVNRRGKG